MIHPLFGFMVKDVLKGRKRQGADYETSYLFLLLFFSITHRVVQPKVLGFLEL